MRAARRTLLLAVALTTAMPAAASPEEDVRATFDRFVAAQNAHDPNAVEGVLLDSPSFLWITRGTPVWGRAEAMKRFESLWEGTWRLVPEAGFRVVLSRPDAAEIFVPIVFTTGASGQPPQETRFLMNQVLVRTEAGWKIAAILPIPAAERARP